MAPRVFALVQKKGGVAKTTSSVGMASILAEDGETILMDEDHEQQSAWKWWAQANGTLRFTAMGSVLGKRGGPPSKLARTIQALPDHVRYVVVDTPPGHPEIIVEAIMAADELIIPLAPSGIEVAQLDPTLELVARTRPDASVRILLTRVKTNTKLAGGVRALLDELGLPVMAAEVPEREIGRGAFGTNDVAELYRTVVEELMA